MSSCLGLYIQDNLIKYAKVTKEREDIKVESYGVKFYDNIGEAIKQIISETYSYKTNISINLSEEAYDYFYFFNLLNKNDLKKAIETEFDSYCYEKGYNRNALETRYALVQDFNDKEKIKAIYISTNKVEINRKLQDFEEYPVSTIASLPMSIANIADVKEKENSIKVNLEEKTTVTTIIDEKIYHIDILSNNMKSVLDKINEKENSYAKAYEICKNSTIYTMEGKDLQVEENLYLEDIMPTLYEIVKEVKDLVENSLNRINKIYITGTGAIINNVDLYFQEYFGQIKCEILKPYFIPQSVKINIKDYMEVNSAISLALQGLDYGVKNINFKKSSFSDKLPDLFKIEVGNKKQKEQSDVKKEKSKFNIKFDFSEQLDATERWLLRTVIGFVSLILIYSGITMFLNNEIKTRGEQVEEVKIDTMQQISLIEQDIQSINTATNKYQEMKQNLEDLNSELTEINSTKNIIPNLLSNIMYYIPQGVTLTSIENTTGRHVVIYAESERYDLLGYFKGVIQTKGILTPTSVISTSGVKQNNVVKIVIEGDMP